MRRIESGADVLKRYERLLCVYLVLFADHGRRMNRQQMVVEARVMTRREQIDRRHKRVRNSVEGTTERPRLAVFRSNNHIYAQVIDDSCGSTLVAASTLTPSIREKIGSGNNVDAAKAVGSAIAELCKAQNIEKVCFDRGGFQYHGRVEALADAAREGGLSF